MVKLTDLEPQFIRHKVGKADKCHGRTMPDGSTQWGGFPVDTFVNEASYAKAHGIRFLCPKCFKKNGGTKGTHSVMIFFRGSPVPAHLGRNGQGQPVRWQASGSNYENLSTTPSILQIGGCNWHGYITNGQATII